MAAAISQKGSGGEPRRREHVAPGLTADGETQASSFVWAAVMGSIEPRDSLRQPRGKIETTLLRQPVQPDFFPSTN